MDGMASGLCDGAKDDDDIDKLKASMSDIREISRKSLLMKMFKDGIYSGGRRWCTNESVQPSKSISSEHGQKFDVFLSHSGNQKCFVRQLHRDLTNQGVSSFFDEDRESSPAADDLHILEAVRTCKIAVVLLSEDFLESKWALLELSAFVEARDKTNGNLKILPLFFAISPKALKKYTADNEKWKQFEKSKGRRVKWYRALKAIRAINGMMFREGGDEVKFRDEIAKEIWRILPTPSPRYHVPCMQGEERMCKELAIFFGTVQPNKEGIRSAGLYGIAGCGKTTLGKALCNYKLRDFEGKVCHLEFLRGDPLERAKHALQYLTHQSQIHLQSVTSEYQAKVELRRRVKRQRVLLVLDNITEETIDEATDYFKADWGENSWILLISGSVDVLVSYFQIDWQSCMHVPRLEEEEAIAILLEPGKFTLGAEDRGFALNCANRCLFKGRYNDVGSVARTFHPLALKASGSYFFSKYGSNLSKWVSEIDSLANRPLYDLDDVFAVLCKAFDHMFPKYRTIFMLLTVYMPSDMSLYKVTEWMAIACNEEISFIENAVECLRKKAFIEECGPKIRIHELYIEFAQSKTKEMSRWLWWKGDRHSTRGLISEDNEGFELAKMEQCKYRNPSQIGPRDLKNLAVLQLEGVRNMSKLHLGAMDRLRCITLKDCEDLVEVYGMENLRGLAWLQIRDVNPMFKLPELSQLIGLQHLEIDTPVSHGLNQLGCLRNCSYLRKIYVRCPSLEKLPRVTGLVFLERVKFSLCDKVEGPLDCRDCVELQSIVLDRCYQMSASPLVAGCNKLSKIVLRACAVKSSPDIDVPSTLKTLEFISSKAASTPGSLESFNRLENLYLSSIAELEKVPSFRRLSSLTKLTLGVCDICKPPDLTCCVKLEQVSFYGLKCLESFPDFSLLRDLKKLSLCECTRVRDPPDISGCHKLQVFHIVHNDNMEGLPKMKACALLEEIKLSWPSEDEVTYEAIPVDNLKVVDCGESLLGHFRFDDLQNLRGVSFPEGLKELQWLKGSFIRLKQYYRGMKVYYSILAPCEQKIVLRVDLDCEKCTTKVMHLVVKIGGVDSVSRIMDCTFTIVGEVHPAFLVGRLMRYGAVDPAFLVDRGFQIGRRMKLGSAHLLGVG